MTPSITHHEILLFAGTTLANQQLADNEMKGHGRKFSPIEQLEKACWNGILYEMFPEILGTCYPKCASFLWRVLPGKNSLYVDIGASPKIAGPDSSIDPYFFSLITSKN